MRSENDLNKMVESGEITQEKVISVWKAIANELYYSTNKSFVNRQLAFLKNKNPAAYDIVLSEIKRLENLKE